MCNHLIIFRYAKCEQFLFWKNFVVKGNGDVHMDYGVDGSIFLVEFLEFKFYFLTACIWTPFDYPNDYCCITLTI